MITTGINQRSSHIYNSLLFSSDSNKPSAKAVCRRDPVLIGRRNNFLCYRFYYKSKVERKLYTDIIEELQKEVYLSAVQITKLINASGEEILRIKKEQPTIQALKKLYPHVIW